MNDPTTYIGGVGFFAKSGISNSRENKKSEIQNCFSLCALITFKNPNYC